MLRKYFSFIYGLIYLIIPHVWAEHAPKYPLTVHVHLTALQWTTIPLPAPVLHLTAHKSWNNCLWATGKDEMIASSCDGGNTWNIAHWRSHGHWIFSMAFAGRKIAYAFGTGKSVWRSHDGGKNWKMMKQSLIPVQYARFDNQGDRIEASMGVFAYRLGGQKSWISRHLFLHNQRVGVLAGC